MITREEVAQLVSRYDLGRLAIGTLGSHSALGIFRGAREEGLRTVCVCRERDLIVYKKFPLADELIVVEDFSELLEERVQERLRELNAVLVPHGSFTAYLSVDDLLNRLYVPMFGNRRLLEWEVDREKQAEWLRRAGLRLPRSFKRPEDASGLVIAKLPGARGGRGYFLASSPEDFYRKAGEMASRGLISRDDVERIQIQEYVLGANVYFHYFSSIIDGEVEFLGADRRYESIVDSLGRVPAPEQLKLGLSPTYTVVGNIPVVLRESLLPEVLRMGDGVQRVARELAPPGIIGPFCLEAVITDSLEIYVFEISARIVAGMNVWIDTSPYTYLKYGEGMWAGRRIAREVRRAVELGRLEEVVY